jgi:hypothetical protein
MKRNCSYEKSGTHCTAREQHIPEASCFLHRGMKCIFIFDVLTAVATKILTSWRSESGTNTPTFRRNAPPRSQDVKARSSSTVVHFLQTARRQIYDSIRLIGELLAYLSNKTTFSKSPTWAVPLLCTVEWHGSLIKNYAAVCYKAMVINFTIHPAPKMCLIYILTSITL